MTSIHVYATPEEAFGAVAEFIAEASKAAVERSGRFTIALSGGNTTRAVYRLLARPPFLNQIAWNRWRVFWGDERNVPPDHADSNYRMAREALLNHAPIPVPQVHRFLMEQGAETAANAMEAVLGEVFADTPPSLDLILLGVGDDGHTASLFPGTDALREQERLVVSNHVPQLHADRVTFTLPLINAANAVAFVVTGAAKSSALKDVLTPTPGTPALPASVVKPTSGTLDWFLTADAASQLNGAA